MGIDLYKNETIKDKECTYCMKCIETCPKKNTKVNILGAKVNASLASAAAILGFIGMYSVSGVLADAAQMNQATVDTTNITGATVDTGTVSNSTASNAVRVAASTVTTAAKKYKDGTYTGAGVGFRPGTQVSVTIKNSKITSIKVTATQDDKPFYQRAYNTVIKSIISKQKTTVSSVSGATYSSEGIMSAVANALAKAKI